MSQEGLVAGKSPRFYNDAYQERVETIKSHYCATNTLMIKYGRKRGVGANRYSHFDKMDSVNSLSPGEEIMSKFSALYSVENLTNFLSNSADVRLLWTYVQSLANKINDAIRNDDKPTESMNSYEIQILTSTCLLHETLMARYLIEQLSNTIKSEIYESRDSTHSNFIVYSKLLSKINMRLFQDLIDRCRRNISQSIASYSISFFNQLMEKNKNIYNVRNSNITKVSSEVVKVIWAPIMNVLQKSLLTNATHVPTTLLEHSLSNQTAVATAIEIVCNKSVESLISAIQSYSLPFNFNGVCVMYNEIVDMQDWISGVKKSINMPSDKSIIHDKTIWFKIEAILLLLFRTSRLQKGNSISNILSWLSSQSLKGSVQSEKKNPSQKFERQDRSVTKIDDPYWELISKNLSTDEILKWEQHLSNSSSKWASSITFVAVKQLKSENKIFANIELDYSKL